MNNYGRRNTFANDNTAVRTGPVESVMNSKVVAALMLEKKRNDFRREGYIEFRNNIGTISDLGPKNLGYTSDGELKAFDLLAYKKGGNLRNEKHQRIHKINDHLTLRDFL